MRERERENETLEQRMSPTKLRKILTIMEEERACYIMPYQSKIELLSVHSSVKTKRLIAPFISQLNNSNNFNQNNNKIIIFWTFLKILKKNPNFSFKILSLMLKK